MNTEIRIGYIYKISGYGLNYYGSTIQSIKDRIWSHKGDYKLWKSGKGKHKCYSYDILDKGDDWTYEVLDTRVTDKKKTGLLELENEYIKNNECVNKIQAIQTKEDLKEYKRKWEENKRQKLGIVKKEKLSIDERKQKATENRRKQRANMSEEKHQEILAKRRETYDNSKQIEYVNRPDVKEKRLADQQRKRAAVKLFNILPFSDCNVLIEK